MKETHAHIDKLIRDGLNELPPPVAPAAGWDALERALDAPKDTHLLNALNGLAATEAVTGWQALERKLNHPLPQDVRLAEQLNRFTPAVAAGSWEELATRLDKETDEAVDAIVTDGLARTLPMVSSGWAALAARLELIGWRRSTLAAWKVTEGALLMSMLLLLFRFGPEAPQSLGPVAELHDGFPLPGLSSDSDKTTGAEALVPISMVPKAPATETPTIITPKQKPPATRPVAVDVPVGLPTSGSVIRKEAVPYAGNHNPYLPEAIATLGIAPLSKMISIPSPMLNLAEVDNSVPVFYYGNVFISPLDVNQVVTPGHSAGEFDISSERRYTTGFTAGGLLDINKGFNTLQVGVIYSRRAYLPASLKWRYQDYFTPQTPVEGFSKFVYHALEFHLNYKRTLAENDRWRISARGGMSLSVIAKPVIKDQEEVVAKLDQFEDNLEAQGFGSGNSFIPGGSRRSPQSDFSSERKLKDPPKGWLEGGSILVNSSFYLGGGVTVERIINPRWSLYLSPSIGRVIYLRDGEGIGPYQDRIHLGSLRMGSRFRFGGKK